MGKSTADLPQNSGVMSLQQSPKFDSSALSSEFEKKKKSNNNNLLPALLRGSC